MFQALLLDQGDAGFSCPLTELGLARLPSADRADVPVRPAWAQRQIDRQVHGRALVGR